MPPASAVPKGTLHCISSVETCQRQEFLAWKTMQFVDTLIIP